MINSIKTIAPYTQKEVKEALIRLAKNPVFIKGVQYFHPHWSAEQVRAKLKECRSCADFEIIFVEPIIKNIIEKSITHLEVKGLGGLKKEDYFLCISNHRDIFLDAGLLQYSLYHQGLPFTEISLGDNLMADDLIETVAKLNNMFTVYRTGNRAELLRNARHLSAYLRYAITEKKVAAWIAQSNGRTKDGNDSTAPGLVNMLLMSGGADYKKSLLELNPVIATISYEYEPCAFEKAIEMETRAQTGSYQKSKYEDMNSILSGIEKPKGNVSLVLERLDISTISFLGNRKEAIRAIAQAIDKMVYKNYRLWKTNYIAYDLLHKTKQYQSFYTSDEVAAFKAYLYESEQTPNIIQRVLGIYARPVENVHKVSQ